MLYILFRGLLILQHYYCKCSQCHWYRISRCPYISLFVVLQTIWSMKHLLRSHEQPFNKYSTVYKLKVVTCQFDQDKAPMITKTTATCTMRQLDRHVKFNKVNYTIRRTNFPNIHPPQELCNETCVSKGMPYISSIWSRKLNFKDHQNRSDVLNIKETFKHQYLHLRCNSFPTFCIME